MTRNDMDIVLYFLMNKKSNHPAHDFITYVYKPNDMPLKDIASSIQKVTEEIMIKLAKSIRNEYGIKNLCLAGGVALNCLANGKILKN